MPGPHSRPGPWLLLGALFALLLFADLAVTESGAVGGSDRGLELAAHHTFGRGAYGFFEEVSLLGGGEVRVALIVAIVVALAFTRHWWLAATVAAATGGAAVLDALIKDLVRRPRPHLFPHPVSASGYSFPSGHATDAMAFAAVAVYLLWVLTRGPRRTLLLALLAVVAVGLVGLSRVVLGVHYPSDVLGGYALGLGWVALCIAAAAHLARRRDERPV